VSLQDVEALTALHIPYRTEKLELLLAYHRGWNKLKLSNGLSPYFIDSANPEFHFATDTCWDSEASDRERSDVTFCSPPTKGTETLLAVNIDLQVLPNTLEMVRKWYPVRSLNSSNVKATPAFFELTLHFAVWVCSTHAVLIIPCSRPTWLEFDSPFYRARFWPVGWGFQWYFQCGIRHLASLGMICLQALVTMKILIQQQQVVAHVLLRYRVPLMNKVESGITRCVFHFRYLD